MHAILHQLSMNEELLRLPWKSGRVFDSFFDLSKSVSSILSKKEPPSFFVDRKLNKAVRRLPKCRKPVGLGQNLVLFTFITRICWKLPHKVRIIASSS